jgi:hypothetical protein
LSAPQAVRLTPPPRHRIGRSFAGQNASGVATKAKPPIHISPTNGCFVEYRSAMVAFFAGGLGDRIFLTMFADGELQTRCYDARKGQMLWSHGTMTREGGEARNLSQFRGQSSGFNARSPMASVS